MLTLEVMDKELTASAAWLWATTVGVAGYFLTRWRRWLLVLPIALLALTAVGVTVELMDPYVGPAILQEAGRGYPVVVYAAHIVGLGLAVAGLRAPRRSTPAA